MACIATADDINYSQIEEQLNITYGIVPRAIYSQEDFDLLSKMVSNRMNENPDWDTKWSTDEVLRRFLQTFCTVPETTEKLVQYFDWRSNEKVDEINPYDPAMKRILTGHSNVILDDTFDRCGRPILVIRARNHRTDENADDIWKSAVYYLERVCEQSDSTELKDFCLVFDLGGFTTANMDFPLAQKFFKALKDYYPERVGVVLIINYPFLIHSIWMVIKLWLYQRLRSKFIFCGEKEFDEFVDMSKLPLELF